MYATLTLPQILALRRCSGGLRVWEVGDERVALLSHVIALHQLRLVSFDENGGYETTTEGESWLSEFDG